MVSVIYKIFYTWCDLAVYIPEKDLCYFDAEYDSVCSLHKHIFLVQFRSHFVKGLGLIFECLAYQYHWQS